MMEMCQTKQKTERAIESFSEIQLVEQRAAVIRSAEQWRSEYRRHGR
jgi:hypothetical protein